MGTRLLVRIHQSDVAAMGTGWTTTGIGRRDVTDGDGTSAFLLLGISDLTGKGVSLPENKNGDNQMFSISLIKLRNESAPILK